MKNIAFIFILLLTAAAQMAAQSCIEADNCFSGTQVMCDASNNDPQFWNEAYWLDPLINSSNLAEGEVGLSITATDTCVGGSITISYILYLDLDASGTWETVVESDNLPGYNVVYFDNAFNPDFSGGTARAFDERTVGANELYGFALETVTNGATTTARVRWNTEAAPGTYVNPLLPYGTHKIKWRITDSQDNDFYCEYPVKTTDCGQPSMTCSGGVNLNLQSDGTVTLWATDLIQFVSDNYIPVNAIQTAIRKAGTGSGFPTNSDGSPQTSVTYDCTELGDQPVELWARDLSGNNTFCQTAFTLSDPFNYCALADLVICTTRWCDDAPINNTGLIGLGGFTGFDPATGCSSFENVPFNPPVDYLPLFPLDTDPLNGLDALDMIRIARHILGIQPLGSPYAMIAADVNKSSTITTFDLVEERKLLLGIYTEFPNNTSWRWADAGFVFPNPNNPFQTAQDTLVYSYQNGAYHFKFYGIKTGDVDCSGTPGFKNDDSDDRSVARLKVPDVALQAGETLELPVFAAENAEWLGFQLGLRFDPSALAVEAVVPGKLPGMDDNAFARPQPGLLNALWFDTEPRSVSPANPLFTLRLKALAPVRTGHALHLSDGKLAPKVYTASEAAQKLDLQFEERAQNSPAAVWQVQPNPTSGSAVLPLQLAGAQTVVLELTDIAGKSLWLNRIQLDAGEHRLEIPAAAFPEPGVYTWRLRAGELLTSGKLVKM